MDVSELQRDLLRKHRNVGGKVQEIWRNFTPKQREKAMREAVGEGRVLRHSRDPGLDGLKQFLPDWNLRDVTSTPDFFLDRWRFRAETELQRQEVEGANGGPSDREVIGAGAHSTLSPSKARLLLSRQTSTFIFYNHLVEEILDLDLESRPKNPSSVKRATADPGNAMAKLTLQPKPLKASIAEIIAHAADQKAASESYLELLRSEPIVLNHAVNMKNMSRPELVPDDRGRILPMFTDKYLSIAFFEVMCDSVKALVTWEYIVHLLRMLEGGGMDDKIKRPLVMQELSNTCHLEYRRAQAELRRQMSVPFGVAAGTFKRITTGDTTKIALKRQPSDYTASNPQLHYILRLCHNDTRHTEAAKWIQKLDDHNTRYPDDFERLEQDQVRALGDLAIILSFMHTLSTSLAMVAGSKKLGILFTGRTVELDTELAQHKPEADFGDHLVPVDNLLEPGVASNALQSLNEFLLERAGTRLGLLYEDLLHDCLKDVEKKYSDAKLRLERAEKDQQPYVPLPADEAKPASFRIEQRREKAKTRPADETSAYDITAIAAPEPEVVAVPAPQFKVKASTAAVFHTIFAKATARGSVAWADFATAMADLHFSVTPKGGSVYTFNPPESMGAGRSLTLHRPHASEIEGYGLLIFSRRLQRTYGWTAETFEAE
ncbi:unnamed protein product [Zymoseptoria tritici ST99CH_3D7]|uniref:Ipa protein n=4 Tax=Zymoseptoria tritici TaxID=1047171 RepID=F9X4J9_ZYMTI|nr:uncharacterized protein MYCGRDRAFT_37533 [Zymoseptoria tritici IPO323]EGP90058.1 hypothetical protein MYCGRDRAFT_37533 [Zymoseptoria tritici IPO323]SMQ47936.1 unnamed protein product [Zymoseptoria tritici ST99CH_3D7]